MEESEENKENEIYKQIINDYLLKNTALYNIKDISKININFQKLGGGLNKNYLIKIENKEKNEMHKFFFRMPNKLMNDEAFDRKKEVEIIKKLGEMGYGPKLLDFDYKNEKYRIDEYLDDTIDLPHEMIFDENIINNLIVIINKYSQISDIYQYEIIEEDSKHNIKLNQIGSNPFTIKNNIYDNIINNLYYKAKEKFDKYSIGYNESKIRNKSLNDNNMNKIKNIMNEFQSLFSSFFNKKGFFILNHHDLYGLNILFNKNTKKIYVIDNEFSCLSLIGFDIIWYLLMSLFQYQPKYEYYPQLIDYQKFYQIYLKYLDCFEKTYENWINKGQERIDYIKNIKKENYFCELLCLANLFSYIFSLINLTFDEKYLSENEDIFYINVLNRIQLLEYAYEKLKKVQSK